ncbi:propionyl-CoA synthetase [Aestuariispira insulae]|uniref:Propionyl-CoA synthetase n=2 Tax=Aestuariispira insulae TaxID=1461337 RepID=A0A3D9HWV8_9PROT|nr:propionyl-CoA synthetase [Aestuariispira insulae]
MNQLDRIYQHSLSDREGFWAEAADEIDWQAPWNKVLDTSGAPHFYRWFEGARCNTCYNAVDRHVEQGRGDQAALIYDSPITNQQKTLSYSELKDKVAHCAGMMRALGIEKGDRVLIYMPMIPQAAVAMLACARLGAIHSVVFGGFAAHELATRIKDATPRLILTASCGIEPGRVIPYQPLIEDALKEAPGIVENIVVTQREQAAWDLTAGRDHDWKAGMEQAEPAECVSVTATDPLYILYTSGTTGQPKGVMRDNGGHMVALKWSMKHVYDMEPGEVYWAASDVGWVVGHSYIVYAPLLHGCTTVLFEGKPVGTPDAGTFWRVIAEHKVKALFTAPTAFRAIKKEDPDGKLIGQYDLSHFKTLFLAGERCDPDTLNWAQEKLGVPVIDHWWQTETGWAMAANCMGIEPLPIIPGSPTRAVPGYEIQVLDHDGHEVKRGEMGAICVKLPLPPGCLPTLWKADQRFIDAYLSEYPGYYQTGDAGYMDENGYVFVMARTDDIINVAGHRLSTGAMEEVLASHPDVAECAVIGAADSLKGQLPLGFLVLKSGVARDDADIISEVVALVRKQIGPVAAFKKATVVQRLPKTRSGKILRGTMRAIADGTDWKMPATIDDPAILDEIKERLQSIGYAQN